MKFSMNGARRQLSNDAEALRDIARDIINGNFYEKEDLVEAVNKIITHSNVINCVYSKDDPDFTEMSDIQVEHLELNEEGAA